MIALVRQYHSHQTRVAGRVPYWPHCLNVAELTTEALSTHASHEVEGSLLFAVRLAALGHDLYEDTTVTRDEIRGHFGGQVDDLIWWLTNEEGDTNRTAYVAKMARAPEAARLIKLADIIDNTLTVAYGLEDLGGDWARTFFRPIIAEMLPVVATAQYAEFPAAASWLGSHADFALGRLDQQLQRLHDRQAV